MKFKLSILFSACVLSFTASAQQWFQKDDFPGTPRGKSTSFAIGSKIYVMGGIDYSWNSLKDFWEYDVTTETWNQKSDFPGGERYAAISFVINNKGYIGTGDDINGGAYDDLWEYDPVSDSWTQKTGMPAGQPQHENKRFEAFSFVIGTKAYVGGGYGWIYGANSTSSVALYDLWEYNPASNAWSQLSDVPNYEGRVMGIATSVNGKGYLGLGSDVNFTTNKQSFWEYDPALDTWTSKASFPSNYTSDAAVFVLDSILYLVGGVRFSPVALSNQFYKYDPVANSWTALTNFQGGNIAGEFVAFMDSSAFIGTGYSNSTNTRDDFWEFTIATIIDTTDTTGGGVGINQYNFKTDMVIIYPNPAHETISIRSQGDISFLEIYDITGKMMLREKESFEYINIQALKTGIYYVKIKFQDGSIVHQRLTKAN